MTQFFRAGYYEYDKRKTRPPKQCAGCGCDLTNGYLSRKRCSPCAHDHAMKLRDARRRKYKGRVYGKAKLAAQKMAGQP